MFWKKKKEQNHIQKLVAEDGIEHVSQEVADVICQKLKTKDLAYQFVLEEVESASQGNHVAKLFAVESGITPNEYRGALQNSCDEIDGPDGPQLFLINISSQLRSDPDLMIEFRTKVVSKLMGTYYLGRYEGIEPDGIKKYHHLKKLMFNSSVSEAIKLVFSEAGFIPQSKIDLVTSLLSDDVRQDFYTCIHLAGDLREITGIAVRELLVATFENRNDFEIRSLITKNGKENLSAHRIDEVVEKQPEPESINVGKLYVNNGFPVGMSGFTFDFEFKSGEVRTAVVSSNIETSDLFIRPSSVSVNLTRLPGFEKPAPTKPNDIVEVRREIGDTFVFTPGLYRVGDLDGDIAPLTFIKALGQALIESSDNPLNFSPEIAHDFFHTLLILSSGYGLPLDQISPDYYMVYQIIWPEFSSKIYDTESIQGYKLAEEYRAGPAQMVTDLVDSAYKELGCNKLLPDLSVDELKQLYVLAGYKLARVIYDKAPDDHAIKETT